MLNSRDYHSHIQRVHRTPSVLTDVPPYPNAHLAFNKKVTVYEEDEGALHHHHHHRHPEERVEVVETAEVDNYGAGEEVVYQENVDVENDQYYPRRNRGGFELHKWKTFRH